MGERFTRQCSWCKRVFRDGLWTYTTEILDPLTTTHGMCRECADRLYPGITVSETPPPVPALSPTRKP